MANLAMWLRGRGDEVCRRTNKFLSRAGKLSADVAKAFRSN